MGNMKKNLEFQELCVAHEIFFWGRYRFNFKG